MIEELSRPDHQRHLSRRSFVEMRARERAQFILDPGTFRELLGPFDRVKSPWLGKQGVTAQSDDGVVAARGMLNFSPAAIVMLDGAFQGGSLGEVSGAKIAGMLELAIRSCESGHPVPMVLGLETGGVRLQEANLGLAAIAEIHAGIVALRRHVPVIGIIAGTVGCFGGMSLAAALCSWLIVTREARLALNGPEVIEQEAGLAELDSKDRPLIWRLIGGEQRCAVGMADELVDDDAHAIAVAVRAACLHPPAERAPLTARTGRFMRLLQAIDPAAIPDATTMRALWAAGGEGDRGK
jgi:malonate decarboxylase beta subunit